MSYDYSSGSWGDLLTSYWGNSITYDGVGNPLTWGDYGELTWQGRRLMRYYESEMECESLYTYNADGIRTSKTVNGVKHTYHLSGTQILSEEWTDRWNRHVMVYIYDAAGQPIGMSHFQDGTLVDTYLYEKNIQGDVVAVYEYDGDLVVRYAYNAWGAVSETEYGSEYDEESFEVLCNPFRYRGYYYDTDTGFYYVSSRYYDPEVGRFINADDIDYLGADGSPLSYNLFAYCMNNPVNRFDVNGNLSMPNWLKVTVGAVAIAGLAVATVCTGGAVAVICGAALSGAIAGGASGVVMGAIGGGISGGWQGALDGACSGFMSGTLIGGATGMVSAGFNIATGTTTIVGNAHGSILHKLATNIEAGKMAMTGEYSQIGVNKSLGKMGLNGGLTRPDVIGIGKNGVNKIVEVVSPRQSTSYISAKMAGMLSENPNTIGKIINWVRRLFRK